MHSLQHPVQPMQRLDMFSLRKHDWLKSRQENKKEKKRHKYAYYYTMKVTFTIITATLSQGLQREYIY